MNRRLAFRLAAAPVLGALLLLLSAFGPGRPGPAAAAAPATAPSTGAPASARTYGPSAPLGNGLARAYVIMGADGSTPVEYGVAVDEAALDGLPEDPVVLHLRLPADAPPPYTFAMVDWNPHGHEPPGVYDVPHFDFHFYTTPESDVEAINPDAADYTAEANFLPTDEYVPPFYSVLAGPDQTPADVAVPAMGVHWVDGRSPELQKMFGHPDQYKPFTKTLIYGSWNGRFTFLEPMITRAFLLTHPDGSWPVPQPKHYQEPGWFPASYRIRYDPGAHEYTIALTELSWRD